MKSSQSDPETKLPRIREKAIEEAQAIAEAGVTEIGKSGPVEEIRRRTEFQERKRDANIIAVVNRADSNLKTQKHLSKSRTTTGQQGTSVKFRTSPLSICKHCGGMYWRAK